MYSISICYSLCALYLYSISLCPEQSKWEILLVCWQPFSSSSFFIFLSLALSLCLSPYLFLSPPLPPLSLLLPTNHQVSVCCQRGCGLPWAQLAMGPGGACPVVTKPMISFTPPEHWQHRLLSLASTHSFCLLICNPNHTRRGEDGRGRCCV